MGNINKYSCPKCGGKLSQRDNKELCCAQCYRIFQIREGVPDFLGQGDLRGWKARKRENKLLELSEEIGWRSAAKQIYGGTDLEHWVMGEFRGNGCLITSINPESVVLDAGCGLGAITFYLSKICKEVHSFDSLFEYLKFIKMRALQDNIENIFPVRGELMNLPFKREYFDLIICNGVLEHMPFYYTKDLPTNIQVEILKKFNHVLKPGGELYIGIENRYGLKYCIGSKDEHTGLRFITVLPRCAANFYSKIVVKKEYRPYTYSYKGLRGILRRANFKLKKVYMPVRDYREVRLLIDLQEPQAFAFALKLIEKYFTNYKTVIFEKLIRTGLFFKIHHILLHKFFSHSFSIVAEKQEI